MTAERSHWFTRKWLHTIDVAPHVLVLAPSLNHQNRKIVWFTTLLLTQNSNICMFYTFALLVYMPIDVYVPPLQRPSLTCLTNTSTTLTVRVISRHSPHNRDQRQLVCVCESALYATGQSQDMFLNISKWWDDKTCTKLWGKVCSQLSVPTLGINQSAPSPPDGSCPPGPGNDAIRTERLERGTLLSLELKMPKTDTLDALDDAMTTILTINL